MELSCAHNRLSSREKTSNNKLTITLIIRLITSFDLLRSYVISENVLFFFISMNTYMHNEQNHGIKLL